MKPPELTYGRDKNSDFISYFISKAIIKDFLKREKLDVSITGFLNSKEFALARERLIYGKR